MTVAPSGEDEPTIFTDIPGMLAGAWADALQYVYEEGYITRPQLEALQESNPHRRAR